MVHGIEVKAINADRINGLKLKKKALEQLYESMRKMTVEEKMELVGLDRGRAEVIFAGLIVVIGILSFCQAHLMTVSFSDLLEGVLIEYFEGE